MFSKIEVSWVLGMVWMVWVWISNNYNNYRGRIGACFGGASKNLTYRLIICELPNLQAGKSDTPGPAPVEDPCNDPRV